MKIRQPWRRSALAAASLLALSPAAFAADFVFSTGSYVPGTTAPEPLAAGQVLQINSGGSKFFDGVSFTNQAGLVNWNADTLYLQNGASVKNQAVWNAKSDDALVNNGGALSTFTNSGTFRKSAGSGNTSIGTIAFVNSGTIDAQTGSIYFGGGNATFNAGSVFTGAGSVVIGNNASFNGGLTSSNLVLSAGSYTGTGAKITGAVTLSGGYVQGDWEVASGQTLNGANGGSKFLNGGALTNNGTVNWKTGDALYLQNGSSFTNNGLHDIQATSAIVNNGGALSTYTNSSGATLRVASGQTATIGTIGFTNNGGTLTANGTINYNGSNATFGTGTVFNGSGTNLVSSNAAFNGAISSGNLVLQNGVYQGTAVALSGTTDFTGGYLSGTWQLGAAQTLNAKTGNSKFLDGGSLVNKGSVNWQTADALYLQNGSSLDNQGSFTLSTGATLVNNGGALSTFTNSGTLHLATGEVGAVGTIAFVNNAGVVQSDGTLTFGGNNAVFSSGTKFTGTGVTNVTSNASFVDNFDSANLRLVSGFFTGGNGSAGSKVVAKGQVDLTGGYLTGTWELAAGQSLNALDGGNKFLNEANFTNKGTLAWKTTDSFYLQNNSSLDNQQLLDLQESMTIANNGGGLSSLTNNKLMKVASGKTVNVGTIQFVNNSTLNVAGTLNFNGYNATFNDGSVFTGAGVVAINSDASFVGTQNTSNLSLRSGTFTGTGAVVQGSAEFTGGYLQGGWTVASGQTLYGRDGGNKFVNAATVTNNGTIAWQTGNTLYLQNAGSIDNRGLFDMQTGATIANNGGQLSTFTNSGTLRVAAGQSGVIGSLAFVNNAGTVDVGTGASLNFNGNNVAFNAGTKFTGSGVAMVNGNAGFNGDYTSSNLSLRSGVFTGAGAVAKGSTEFSGGYLQGDWKVASGATLTVAAGGNKFLDGVALTNQGTIALATSNTLYVQNGASIANAGKIDLQTDSAIINNGGAASSFVNTGLILKSAGTGVSTIGNGVGFDNQGVMNVATGTIGLPNDFTNNGTLKGVGAYASTTLTNNGHVAPGDGVGTLTIAGNFAQTALGSFDIQTESLLSTDKLVVQGSATLGGTLALSCFGTCSYAVGDTFTILDANANSLSGTFANVTYAGYQTGQFQVIYDLADGDVMLKVTQATSAIAAVPEPATWATMFAGLGMLVMVTRRRSNRRDGAIRADRARFD